MRYETFDVAVDGGNLRVGRFGVGGEVVLAAHGITGNHLHFAALANQLVPDFTVVAPDLRGRGRSSDIAGPFSMSAHAADLVAVLDHLEVEKATIVGHSMGGFAAVVCADRYPDRVQRLVLVNGGIPLELGSHAGLPTEQLLTALIGPALDRLQLTFESVPAYLDYWRQHPALTTAWNADLERALSYDLGGRPPTLRCTVRMDAVLADVESELTGDEFDCALKRLTTPAILLRPELGMFNQIAPLYPDSVAATWLAVLPTLSSVVVPAMNHYTILLTERGTRSVSDVVKRFPAATWPPAAS